MRRWWQGAAWLVLGSLALGGCEAGSALPRLPAAVLQAGDGSASKTRMRNVVPSRPAAIEHRVVVQDERYLGDIARQLGVTTDALRLDNDLADGPLKSGMVLKVRTSKDLVDAFEARRERIKQARIAAEEAKRQAKIKADAEARAAKRRARLEARRIRGKGAKIKQVTEKAPANPTAGKLVQGKAQQGKTQQGKGISAKR